jgi:hypothetical protein
MINLVCDRSFGTHDSLNLIIRNERSYENEIIIELSYLFLGSRIKIYYSPIIIIFQFLKILWQFEI